MGILFSIQMLDINIDITFLHEGDDFLNFADQSRFIASTLKFS